MMRKILEKLKAGDITLDEAQDYLEKAAIDRLKLKLVEGLARLDVHREARAGIPEVILTRGKKPSWAVISEISLRKETPVLIVDESHLMRLEVFAQLHTLLQFDFDSKPVVPLVLAGQNTLMDKLHYHTSRPLASRVVSKSHLDGLKLKEMQAYLKHHLEITGIKEQLFSDEAILTMHQGSGGLLRRANLLARGAFMSAAMEKLSVVSAEHVRVASTEII